MKTKKLKMPTAGVRGYTILCVVGPIVKEGKFLKIKISDVIDLNKKK